MFQAAAAGAAGINFHGGIHSPRASDDKAYTPIARMGNRYRAATLYYGMLMFAQAAPGSLIPAQLAPDTSGLKAFAVRAPDETLCVCINQNITRDERVAINSGRSFTAASVLRLAGPAIDATGGVTCFIVKRPAQGAMIGAGTLTKAEAPAPEADDVL